MLTIDGKDHAADDAVLDLVAELRANIEALIAGKALVERERDALRGQIDRAWRQSDLCCMGWLGCPVRSVFMRDGPGAAEAPHA